MSAGRSAVHDSTLLRLALAAAVLLAAAAALDLALGRGGSAWLFGSAAAATARAEPAAVTAAGDVLFRNVRVFDGETFIERTSVRVRDGSIAEVGEDVEAGDGPEVIDGAGLTLMPGLIDAHVHTWGDALRADAVMGVTTVLDMFTDPGFAAAARTAQAEGSAGDRADLYSAGILATSPGGHGTEYGMNIPTLDGPEDAEGFVDDRVAEGSDYIKIVYEHGSLGRRFTSLDLETVKALIDAAHARGLLAVVHVSRQEDAREVIAAGADGIAHVFYDSEATPETVQLVRDSGAFVVPTLAVLESIARGGGGADLVADSRLAPFMTPAQRANLQAAFPGDDDRSAVLDRALASIRALHAAGVPVLAGTDAPNPGTAHGFSLHRELVLLARAGLGPSEALAAATSLPAREFGLDDRGVVREGARADLLLVRGDPRDDLTATRDIVAVWKAGRAIDRDAYRRGLKADESTGPLDTGTGLASDFESGEADSEFGSGWMVSTDEMMGGDSTGAMRVVDGGARGSAHALEISGEIAGAGQLAWSGAMFMPGAQPFQPADVSDRDGFSFAVRGKPQTIVIMVFARSLGQMPSMQQVPVTEEWTVQELSFADFPGVDASGLMAILFSGSEPGGFAFRVDDVRLR